MDIKKIFGENVKKYRKAQGYTQIQLAELLDVDQKHISFIENGNSFPSANLIAKISEVLSTEPKNLFATHKKPTVEEMKYNLIKLVQNASDKDIEKIYEYFGYINLKNQI